jgi:hypothetical protein
MYHDLEMCFFLTHDKTGCTCICYRSLEKKMIAVSFRGTCQPVDLITDASLIQETWIEGEDVNNENVRKVHKGFRYGSLRFDAIKNFITDLYTQYISIPSLTMIQGIVKFSFKKVEGADFSRSRPR